MTVSTSACACLVAAGANNTHRSDSMFAVPQVNKSKGHWALLIGGERHFQDGRYQMQFAVQVPIASKTLGALITYASWKHFLTIFSAAQGDMVVAATQRLELEHIQTVTSNWCTPC